MLKCCARPLFTLVLALVATCLLSTLSPARDFRKGTAPAAAVQGGARRPAVNSSGEPDQPSAPPPARYNNGVPVATPSSFSEDGDLPGGYRWTSWIWAFWLSRAAL
jgi:hypothetical protein